MSSPNPSTPEAPEVPCSDFVLTMFPKPCHPNCIHECRICGTRIEAGEECCSWSGVIDGVGWWTSRAHPECYDSTREWEYLDWKVSDPGDFPRPPYRMRWPVTRRTVNSSPR